MKRKNPQGAFTLIELIVVLAILAILAAIVGGGIIGGCKAGGIGNLMSERTAVIRIDDKYPLRGESGTTYRIDATVLEGTEDPSIDHETTFEISDSLLKRQMRSADLFRKLKKGQVYRVTYYGVRSGFGSFFPKIIAAVPGDDTGDDLLEAGADYDDEPDIDDDLLD